MVNDSIEEVGKEINEDHFARALKGKIVQVECQLCIVPDGRGCNKFW